MWECIKLINSENYNMCHSVLDVAVLKNSKSVCIE